MTANAGLLDILLERLLGWGGQGEFEKLALTLRVRQQKRTFRDNPGKLEREADSADS